jgi:hypothetical protein
MSESRPENTYILLWTRRQPGDALKRLYVSQDMVDEYEWIGLRRGRDYDFDDFFVNKPKSRSFYDLYIFAKTLHKIWKHPRSTDAQLPSGGVLVDGGGLVENTYVIEDEENLSKKYPLFKRKISPEENAIQIELVKIKKIEQDLLNLRLIISDNLPERKELTMFLG